jgi:hypothetical protein
MRVSDAQVAALRAFLVRNLDATVHLTAQLGNDGMRGYLYLAEAALSVTARRRFSPQFTSADLVRYVASVRVSRTVDGTEYDLDPVSAENVLRYFLGEVDASLPNSEERLRTVVALLDALAASELSSELEIDALLWEAREVANRWMANGLSCFGIPTAARDPGQFRRAPHTTGAPCKHAASDDSCTVATGRRQSTAQDRAGFQSGLEAQLCALSLYVRSHGANPARMRSRGLLGMPTLSRAS